MPIDLATFPARLGACAIVLAGLAAPLPAIAADPVPAQLDGVMITTKVIASGLDTPLFLASPPGDKRLFILEKPGRIRIIENGALLPAPFLDLTASVSTEVERGLLGLAFDPDFATNRRLYIDYTAAGSGAVTIASLTASTDPNVADAASLATILSIDHPFLDHNGGWIGFGPDGYLYIAVGDGGENAGNDSGGGIGDTADNAQTLTTLLGKMLRIDVHGAPPYAIPPGNPFANGGGAPEVFAYGLRNPWRNAFDGDILYIADVGNLSVEEINAIPVTETGANFGWRMVEGDSCYMPYKCDKTGTVAPVHAYRHLKHACSVTGGYVYRGKAIPALQGRYFFADYCSGIISSFRLDGGAATSLVALPLNIGVIDFVTSFGVDSDGELYVLFSNGMIEKLVPANG